MDSPIRSVLHPTDFSPMSLAAFAHALRVALATKCKLYVLHVLQEDSGEGWEFPEARLRSLLVQWGQLNDDEPVSAIEAKVGLSMVNITYHRAQTPVQEIMHFVNQHACDLIVMATHGRDGIEPWLEASIAETVFRRCSLPTLFIPRNARGFVDQATGEMRIRHALVPIDHSPAPYRAIEAARAFTSALTGTAMKPQLLHVGPRPPTLSELDSVTLRYGNVVQTILNAAVEYDADFICMPTAGHHGVLDALRGSTTERVLRHAPCPLLAISAKA
jgi:nucleotide-binding universal stress UspA family protein